LAEVTEDVIRMCHHPLGGDYTVLGWRPGCKPVTFPVEGGAHAGPGTRETDAFALLPSDILPASEEGGYLRTRDLREAALRLLGRLNKKEAVLAARPDTTGRLEDFKKTRLLRVMTYNVHSCIGTDGKISPRRVARVIGRHEPDIVAVQELDLKRPRTGGMDQPRMIAKELEMRYHFHPNIKFEEERYGNAVLSRYPLTLVKADKLPARNAGWEPRGAMWCSVDIGGKKIQVVNTHLGLRQEERFRQVTALCGPRWLSHPDCRGPLILCGDFNALPNSRVCRSIRRRLRDVQMDMEGHSPRATWFSRWPLGRIDHIFVGPGIEVVRVAVSDTDLDKKSSDHLPLVVDIRISLDDSLLLKEK
jgi:endonuclease/exonuclease/phosphatase family metal-dependent hydrolase